MMKDSLATVLVGSLFFIMKKGRAEKARPLGKYLGNKTIRQGKRKVPCGGEEKRDEKLFCPVKTPYSAARPACATVVSSATEPPETPMPPTIFPSTTIGKPPPKNTIFPA